jgi:hypothetical protein
MKYTPSWHPDSMLLPFSYDALESVPKQLDQEAERSIKFTKVWAIQKRLSTIHEFAVMQGISICFIKEVVLIVATDRKRNTRLVFRTINTMKFSFWRESGDRNTQARFGRLERLKALVWLGGCFIGLNKSSRYNQRNGQNSQILTFNVFVLVQSRFDHLCFFCAEAFSVKR